MKKEDTKNEISGIEKNIFLYYNEYLCSNNFQLHFRLMKRKWNLPICPEYNFGDDKSLLMKKFEDKYGLKATYEFVRELKNLVKICNMGNHWIDCVGIKLLTGKTFIPTATYSVVINKQEKKFSIELGPHTTRRDLESAWVEIEKKQQDIWPGIKKWKISKKSLEDIFLFIEDLKLREPKMEREKWEDILNQIKVMDMHPEEKEEAIQNLQKTITKLQRKELKDREIITKLWDDDSDGFENILKVDDKRRMDRLRQIRKRKEATI